MEEWINLNDIEYFEGYDYSISNQSRVKNSKGVILTPTSRNKNCRYLRVFLTNSQTRKRKSFAVHRLVMMVFNWVDNHVNMTVNHKDENPSNNKLSNLEWMTSGDNIRYSQANISSYGDVKEICSRSLELKIQGMSLNETAKILGIPTGTLYYILSKNNHEHLFKRKRIDVSEVSKLIVYGYDGKKIAQMLNISPSSVSNVRKLIKRDRINDTI